MSGVCVCWSGKRGEDRSETSKYLWIFAPI